MKTLGFLGTKVVRVEDSIEKEYQYKPEILYNLFKKYMPKDEFAHFEQELGKKANSLKGSYHNHLIVYYVTFVTIIYEQGKNGNKQPFSLNVTKGGSRIYNGNIGNMCNNIVENPTEMQKVAGEVFESQPGVWRKVV